MFFFFVFLRPLSCPVWNALFLPFCALFQGVGKTTFVPAYPCLLLLLFSSRFQEDLIHNTNVSRKYKLFRLNEPDTFSVVVFFFSVMSLSRSSTQFL